MADTALNRYVMQGTAAQRATYTPTPATVAAGQPLGIFWFETDTAKLYAWNIGTAAWVLVTGGGGSTAALPTVRATSHACSSNSTYTVALPAGTVAGDLIYAFWEHGFNLTVPGIGWTVVDVQTGTNVNGGVLSRVVNAAEVTTGSYTFGFSGAFDGTVELVTITGIPSPPPYTRSALPVRSSVGAASQAVPSDGSPKVTDLCLAFCGSRGSAVITQAGAGLTTVDTFNDAASASAVFAKGASTAGGETVTFSGMGAATGFYGVVVTVRGD